MVQPINYGALLAPTTPLDPDAFLRGAQGGQVIAQNMQNRQVAQAQSEQARAMQMKAQTDARLAIEAAAKKAEYERQKQADLALLRNPKTPLTEFGRVAVLYPENSEQIKRSQEGISDAEKAAKFEFGSRVLALHEAGMTEEAAQMLEREAARNEVKGMSEQARALGLHAQGMRKDPTQVRTFIASYLASADPEKFAQTEADIASNPAVVAKREAEAGRATVQELAEGQMLDADIGLKRAQAAKYRADIAIDARRMNLDEKKAQADWNKMMQEAAQAGAGAPLETDERKAVGEAAKEAVVLNGSADGIRILADKMRKQAAAGGPSGVRGGLVRKWETFVGNESETTQLRNEFNRFTAQGVVEALPPGAASDRDIGMVRAGFPGENADAAYVASWLDSYERVKRAAAKVKRAESIWLSANQGGSLGPARRAFVLDGKQVNPGDTFVDFVAPPKAASKFSAPKR